MTWAAAAPAANHPAAAVATAIHPSLPAGDEYAYDKESYGKDHYKGDDSYKEGYGKDHYKGGDSYGDYEDKPECDSKQFKMLETALCVDPESGAGPSGSEKGWIR